MNPDPASWLALLGAPDVNDARMALLVVLLMLAAFIDVRTCRIPDWLTAGGATIGLAFGAAVQWRLLGPAWALDGFLWSLGGMAAGLACLLPFHLLRVMGAGDVKLMAMAGAFLGPPEIVPAVLFSGIAGGVAALLFVVARRRLVRFGRNLKNIAQAAALSAVAGLPLTGLPRGASVGNLSYGVSISAGTIAYVAARAMGYL